MSDHLSVLTRKSHDKIHIDIIKATFSCEQKCLFRFLYSMTASDNIQCFLIHGLRIYRNPCHRIIADHPQFFSGDTVRPSGFYGKLCKVMAIEVLHKGIKQDFQLFCLKCRRCSASDIYSVQFFTLLFHYFRNSFNFLTESFQIKIYSVFPLFQRIRTERTIQTDTWTEGNSYIQTVSVLIINILKDFSFSVCNCNGQCRLLRTDHITVPHFLCRFCIFHSGFNKSHRKLCRADSRQVSPGKSFSCYSDQ